MRSVADHLAAVLAGVRPLAPLDLPLLEARGCQLADQVTAPWPMPPFASAAVEGYAVRAADVTRASSAMPVQLIVRDDVPAGYRASVPVGAGDAIRIGSGAPIPTGADAVVARSLTDGGMPVVRVQSAVAVGAGVRRVGEDLPAGHVVLESGAYIGSREVALLAAVGRARIRVRPRPRVVVISTGTELVEPGEDLTAGLIVDSTGYLLTTAAEDAGAVAYRTGPIPDELEALKGSLEDQLVRADLVVTTGGVAATTYDTVKAAMAELGRVDFIRVAMAPGIAQGYGHLGPDAIPVFTLPGRPFSAFVAFEAFVRPVIRRMLGRPDPARAVQRARLVADVEGSLGLRTFLRGRLDRSNGELLAAPIPEPGLLGLRLADCLIVLPEDVPAAAAGSTVEVIPLVAA